MLTYVENTDYIFIFLTLKVADSGDYQSDDSHAFRLYAGALYIADNGCMEDILKYCTRTFHCS